MKLFYYCFILLFLFPPGNVFLGKNGIISFKSEAPLELISATTDKLKGAIKTEGNSFAFLVNMRDFTGFNSHLQREHFNEKFLESDLYPNAQFKGHFIEQINWQEPGTYQIHAKGQLLVHGISNERIIPGTLEIKTDQSIHIQTSFSVLVEDHDISIPEIVAQNIAEEILITVEIVLEGKK